MMSKSKSILPENKFKKKIMHTQCSELYVKTAKGYHANPRFIWKYESNITLYTNCESDINIQSKTDKLRMRYQTTVKLTKCE